MLKLVHLVAIGNLVVAKINEYSDGTCQTETATADYRSWDQFDNLAEAKTFIESNAGVPVKLLDNPEKV